MVDRNVALRMVINKAISGLVMVVVYALFEVVTVYVQGWLALPQQVPQAVPI